MVADVRTEKADLRVAADEKAQVGRKSTHRRSSAPESASHAVPEPLPESALGIATAYRRRGWAVVPVPHQKKGPRIREWPKLRLTEAELPKHFNGKPQNIGVLLGRASGGLVDVDLDSVEAIRIAPLFLPETSTFGRPGRPKSHYLFKCDPPPRTEQFQDVKDENGKAGGMLVELRSTGLQTIFPGSTHPSGEDITFDGDGGVDPVSISANELLIRVKLIAATALLAKHWPGAGSRQNAALALAGTLLPLDLPVGVEEDTAKMVLRAVAEGAGDEELRKRVDTVHATARRLKDGQTATGWPTLTELVGGKVAAKALEWLGFTNADAHKTPAVGRVVKNTKDGKSGGDKTSSKSRPSSPVTVRLSDVEPEEVRWLWPQRIPLGKLTLLVGDPGVGKSFLTLDICSRVSRGAAWPDDAEGQNEAGCVVLLSAEDDLADTIRPRLDSMEADASKVVAITGVRQTDKGGESFFSLGRDLPALVEAIAETKARLVIVDPITAYLGKTDSHNNADVRGLLAPLSAIASRYKCALVAVTHLNKNEEGKKAIYRAMGSLAFTAAARVVWFVQKDPNKPDRRLMLPIKANVIEEPVGITYRLVDGAVEWDPAPVEVDPDAILSDPCVQTGKLEVAKAFLQALLARGPVLAAEVKERAKKAGISERTLDRAKKELGVLPKRKGYGEHGVWAWSLPS